MLQVCLRVAASETAQKNPQLLYSPSCSNALHRHPTNPQPSAAAGNQDARTQALQRPCTSHKHCVQLHQTDPPKAQPSQACATISSRSVAASCLMATAEGSAAGGVAAATSCVQQPGRPQALGVSLLLAARMMADDRRSTPHKSHKQCCTHASTSRHMHARTGCADQRVPIVLSMHQRPAFASTPCYTLVLLTQCSSITLACGNNNSESVGAGRCARAASCGGCQRLQKRPGITRTHLRKTPKIMAARHERNRLRPSALALGLLYSGAQALRRLQSHSGAQGVTRSHSGARAVSQWHCTVSQVYGDVDALAGRQRNGVDELEGHLPRHQLKCQLLVHRH